MLKPLMEDGVSEYCADDISSVPLNPPGGVPIKTIVEKLTVDVFQKTMLFM